MVLLCVSVCKHSNYNVTTLGTLLRPLKNTASTPQEHCFELTGTLLLKATKVIALKAVGRKRIINHLVITVRTSDNGFHAYQVTGKPFEHQSC